MEHRTSKIHSEFDLAAAKKAFAKTEEDLCGEQISSPFDLYSVERLRDGYTLRKGVAFAVDAFVFGFGPAHDRRVTKVSGLPYWPKGRKWPIAPDGSACQFLAQFCFLDSRDLVGKLPGDILLLFVPPDDEEWLWETERVRFEWLTADAQPLIERLPEGVQPYSKSEWYGVLHRTHDYPGVMEKAKRIELDQPYNLPILNGTKIGGIPHAIQSSVEYGIDPTSGLSVAVPDKSGESPPGRFLCQLTSIQAAPDVPYPWTNQEKSLTLDFDDSGIYGDDNSCTFGDMGSVYVFIDASGKCVVTSESY